MRESHEGPPVIKAGVVVRTEHGHRPPQPKGTESDTAHVCPSFPAPGLLWALLLSLTLLLLFNLLASFN